MAARVIEFKFPDGTRGYITNERWGSERPKPGHFKPFYGGCGIALYMPTDQAKETLIEYARSRCEQNLATARETVERLERALAEWPKGATK